MAAAIPDVRVADCAYNSVQIKKMIAKADRAGVEIVCFPELGITAYSCGDLFFQDLLLDSAMKELWRLVETTAHLKIVSIVGLPVRLNGKLFNTAAIFGRGRLLGFVPKTYLPNYNEYYEKRWFASATELSSSSICIDETCYPFTPRLIVGDSRLQFAVEICEDLWAPIPPSSYHCMAGAEIVFNLSASNEITGKHAYRKALVEQQSARCIAGYVYAGAGCGESSTDLVFAGNALIYENGSLLDEAKRFSPNGQMIVADIDTDRLRSQRAKNTSFATCNNNGYTLIPLSFTESSTPVNRYINPLPFVSNKPEILDEIFSIQTVGLAKRMHHTGIEKLVIGVSGGLDSTLALLVCARTCDRLNISRENIIGITMPGFGTGKRTRRNAHALMYQLGITQRTINIVKACNRHFLDIEHNPDTFDLTFENAQARERTQILMDIANQCQGLVVGTGDMSELALGWATYGGDHISMYGVNSGVPKTLVKALVMHVSHWLPYQDRNILLDIIDTPISPELLPVNKEQEMTQQTEDVIGPYELHDFFLFWMLRYGYSPTKICFMAERAFRNQYTKDIILKWMKVFYRRFFAQQFKRSCLPDGPKVGSVNLSPRGDWRMPSDASSKLWLDEIERL